jgi:hypothetical protein
VGGKKEVDYSITSLEDGMNNTDPAVDVGRRYVSRSPRYQVAGCLDFMLHKKMQRPGSQSITHSFTNYICGLGTYLRHSGTEYLLAMSGGKLYSVDKTAGTLTELYDLTGTGEAWFQDYLDICIVANATAVVKVEGTNCYQLGIAAPSGVTAAAVSGGSLDDGVYKIYVSYARKVSGSNVLYSQGQVIGDVTCGAGKNTIRFTFANSSDAQVNNKIIWMTDADGAVWYFYHETDDNTTTSIDVADTSARSTSLLYQTLAQYNYSVPAFEFICVHNGYLYGSVDNTLYRSLQAGSRYDLERFDTSATGNNAEYPFDILGIHTLGEHLYLDTVAGMIMIPYGDITAQYKLIEGEYFLYPRTVIAWGGGLLGLTAKKIGFFDGNNFFAHDIGQSIKPEIAKVLSGANTNTLPCGALYRRSDRAEYHLGYYDTSVSGGVNNRRLVLNLDKLAFYEGNKVSAPWESWSSGANYIVVDNDGTMFWAQSAETGGTIVKPLTTRNVDQNTWVAGTYTAESVYGWQFTTGTFLTSIKGMVRWNELRIFAVMAAEFNVAIYIEKWPSIGASSSVNPEYESTPRYGIARYGVNRYAPEGPIHRRTRLKKNLKGYAVYMVFSQTEEDKLFELHNAMLSGVYTESKFT